MHCGLDFGTTNSSMTYVRNGSLEFAELAKDKKAVPTAAWFEGTKKNVSEVTDQEISIAYNKRFGQPKLGIAGDTLRKRRGYIKEELLRERNKDKSLRLTSIHDSSSVSIGFDALEHFENYDDGLLIKSPKAVIGSNLSTAQAVAFESIIERMLVQYRASAEVNSRLFFDSLVLGRPITWGINSSKVKDAVAQSIMEAAARKAGFRNVEFQLEPLAAVVECEQHILKEKTCLVVDIGGGTTDVAVVRLGGASRNKIGFDRVLGASGTRVGGVDLDIALAMNRFGRLLGREYIGANNEIVTSSVREFKSVIDNAFKINDIPAQKVFKGAENRVDNALANSTGERAIYLERILQLYESNSNLRLVLEAERSKMNLSNKPCHEANLGLIEDGLSMVIHRRDFNSAIHYPVKKMSECISKAVKQSGCMPKCMLVTGGGSLSPMVLNMLGLDNMANLKGDNDKMFGVAKGLGLTASRIFG